MSVKRTGERIRVQKFKSNVEEQLEVGLGSLNV
jgi:hypothetical protein